MGHELSISHSGTITWGTHGMTEQTFDYLVVGAGIVGLTVARELKARCPSARVGVLDKERQAGLHASGRNSGVLHSGIYYASDSRKAKVCASGAALMMEFAAEHGIAYRRSGKVIIGTSEDDLPTIDRLLRNAHQNGIRAWRIDAKDLSEIEPYAVESAPGIIYCPDTAVIDSHAVITRLTGLLKDQGVEFLWDHEVRGLGGPCKVITNHGCVGYGHLFNCAGAYADVVARRFGCGMEYALVPFKGIYWKLRPDANHMVRANIYPVPDIGLPFLGVHFTRVINGDVYIGPTAMPALGRENYGLLQGARLRESMEIGYRILRMVWTNASNFRELAYTEMAKYSKSVFLKGARKLVPTISADDMIATPKAGIRPQLVNISSGALETDYILEHTENSTHVLNAISPAFTGAFAFAKMIVDDGGVVSMERGRDPGLTEVAPQIQTVPQREIGRD